MKIEEIIIEAIAKGIQSLYNAEISTSDIQLQETRKEFEGDITLVVFPFLKISKKDPVSTANELGDYLSKTIDLIDSFNIIKGFLNISIANSYWIENLNNALSDQTYGYKEITNNSPTLMVEYSSPNTNKPLHLGHIRNNLLGFSISQILSANGYKVIKANLINDRGIHICKSMYAWQKWGNGETPESTGKKGDHLVGDYYVKFDKEYKKEITALVAKGLPEEEAKQKAPSILAAREMLKKWENGDLETVKLWKTMNAWVYKGFEKTYKKMGVSFDKIYYESETYLLGKEIVHKGLGQGILYKKEDNSIWADLTEEGLDHKLLLRPDGTSVYMTQDIGTAIQRFKEFGDMKELIYVVGNEQNYHFQVLSIILKKLGYEWFDKIYHMSYGMVELPAGKMKSREGTVVDADDLMAEMVETSASISKELGKLEGYSEEEAERVYETIALGALKYFILKVDPSKKMLFNPAESIDFNGNTGPFIQYTYARINSLKTKATELNISINKSIDSSTTISNKEKSLVRTIYKFPNIIAEAGKEHSPSTIANFVYELVKEYNQFYHDHSILKEEDLTTREFRVSLSLKIGQIIKSGMELLGISVPERM